MRRTGKWTGSKTKDNLNSIGGWCESLQDYQLWRRNVSKCEVPV